MKRAFWSSESGVATFSRMFSILVAIVLALNVTGCSGGGGGGSPGSPPDDEIGPLPIPGPAFDEDSDTFDTARVIFPGEGITTGFYNEPGDEDWFRIPVIENQWYVISDDAHRIRNYNDAHFLEGGYIFQLWDGTLTSSPPSSADWGWAAGAAESAGGAVGQRHLFQAQYTGDYYYRLTSLFNNTVGAYAFKVATSQRAISEPRYDTDNEIFVSIIDEEPGEMDGDPPILLPRYVGDVFGATSISLVDVQTNDVSIFGATQTITFLDDEGVLEEEAQRNVWHIHVGIPSRTLGDSIHDDEQITYPNLNFQNSGGPNDFIAEFDSGDVLLTVPDDLKHVLVETDWYVDAHFTDDYDRWADPVVSSLPMGGVKVFDSTLILDGFTFPFGEESGSPLQLEVAYDDEYQIFYLPYGDRFDHAELTGSRLHVHAGGPSESNTTPLIDLGPIPAPETRPIWEGFADFIPHADEITVEQTDINNEQPGIETIIYTLSDAEAELIADATYTTGWYVDLHTTDQINPELRADAILFDTLEVGIKRPAEAAAFLATKDGKTRIKKGTVTFVSDDLAYGPITVTLNGNHIGQIDIAEIEGEVECGEEAPGQTASKTLKTTTYTYFAHADGVTWRGMVTVEDGVCQKIVLSAADAQPITE